MQPRLTPTQTLRLYARINFGALLVLMLHLVSRAAIFTAPKSALELLEHITGWSEKWAFKSNCYLMLMTGSPATSGEKGVTMKKCKEKETTVTGYTRFKVEAAAGHKLKFVEVSELEAEATNEGEWEIETGLTGSNQEILYWALVQESSGEAGKVISWGSCTGVSIGGTGTPVKIATEKLKTKIG